MTYVIVATDVAGRSGIEIGEVETGDTAEQVAEYLGREVARQTGMEWRVSLRLCHRAWRVCFVGGEVCCYADVCRTVQRWPGVPHLSLEQAASLLAALVRMAAIAV